jgi:DNA-binding CsgD family transcriptional regulator
MTKGIFIIDAAGDVTWTNWPALTSDADGLKVVRGRIATVTQADQKALNGALATALSSTNVPQPLTIIIHGKDGFRRHIIHVVPMHRPTARPSSLRDESAPPRARAPTDGAMVFVVGSEKGLEAAPEMLQEHLGLSPSESRIAALVAAGERPRDIAVKLGLTEESTRVILKRVFSKTGVSRQSELVALISNLTSMPLR